MHANTVCLARRKTIQFASLVPYCQDYPWTCQVPAVGGHQGCKCTGDRVTSARGSHTFMGKHTVTTCTIRAGTGAMPQRTVCCAVMDGRASPVLGVQGGVPGEGMCLQRPKARKCVARQGADGRGRRKEGLFRAGRAGFRSPRGRKGCVALAAPKDRQKDCSREPESDGGT